MDFKELLENRQNISLKIVLIIFGFAILILARKVLGQFGISLGYLYILLIILSGYWLYIIGGIVSAAAALIIFLIELYSYPAYPFREIAVKSVLIRLSAYLLIGVIAGYISLIMQKMRTKLRSLEFYDAQTGCLNSMHIIYSLEKEVKNSHADKNIFSLVLIEIDNFQDINRDYGYSGRNDILKKFVSIIRKDIRNIDLIGRYGENKFLIIFPGATIDQTKAVMKTIDERIKNERITSQYIHGREGLALNFNYSSAEYPLHGDSLEKLIDYIISGINK